MKVISQKILGGTMYAPFCRTLAVDMKEWDNDFAQMKKMGFNCVHGFAEWHDIEYEKGKFDFSKVDHMLDCAHRHGIKAMVNIATMNSIGFYSPRWLMEECRGGDYKSAGAKADVESIYVIPCLDNPTYMKYSHRYLTEVGKHFAGDERVAGYVLWGEPIMTSFRDGGGICYCEHTLARFKQWLKDKYQDIQKLNEVWATEGPSDFASFDDVYPPVGYSRQLGGFASWADWREFMIDNFCSHIKNADTLLKTNGSMQPTIVEMLCDFSAAPSHCDEWKISRCVDIVGVSSFQAPGREVEYIMRESDSIAKVQDKSVFVVECLGGNKVFTPYPYTPTDEEIRSNFLQRIMNGAKGAMYWAYRPRLSDTEGGEFGMTLRNGTPTSRAYAGGAATAEAQKFSDLLMGAKRKAEVAIYVSSLHIIEPDGVRDVYENSRRGTAYMLGDLSVQADFINDDYIQNVFNYKVLILPFSYVMTEATAKTIVEYVKAGGVVIADYLLAFKRPNGICYMDLKDTGLEEVFGVIDADGYNVRGDREINDFGFRAEMRNTKLYLTTAKVLREMDGNPVLTENTCGKGKAYYISNAFFAEYPNTYSARQRKVLQQLLLDAGVCPFMQLKANADKDKGELLSTCLVAENGKKIYSVFNESIEEVCDTVVLPSATYVDLSGKAYTGKTTENGVEIQLCLKGKQTAVFIQE